VLTELEATLSRVEGKLGALLGEGRAQVASLKAEIQRLPQGVVEPLTAVEAELTAFEQQSRSQLSALQSELGQLLPP
jgi:hypothetical protein